MNHPKDHHKCFARLACVKHAASVHPEPGSNSLKKFVQDQIFAWLNFIPFYLLWFCSLRTKFFWTFKDMSLFSYQGSFVCRCLSSNFFIISGFVLFVKNFFNFFEEVFLPLDISVIFWLYQRVSWLSISFLKFFNQSAQQLEIIPPVFPLVNIFFYFFVTVQSQIDFHAKVGIMLGWMNTFAWKSIWRIRHTDEMRSILEVGSEPLHLLKE